MARRTGSYVVCVSNRGYRASLVVRRIYRALSDPDGERHGLVRVIDESGEDYLFPADLFVSIEVPRKVVTAFSGAR